MILIFACEGWDYAAPEATIDYPTAGMTVSGTVLIEITATDDEEMSHVELLVDGESTDLMDDSVPYIIEWNTPTYSNTEHIMTIKAWDANENYAGSESVQVSVDNL